VNHLLLNIFILFLPSLRGGGEGIENNISTPIVIPSLCLKGGGQYLIIYQPAVLIAGATVDSSTTTMMTNDKMIDDERLLLHGEEEQLLGLPKHDPTAKMTEEGGVVDEFGLLTSGQAIIQGMVLEELELPPRVVVTTEVGEGSTSDLSSDDEDFLDLLVDTLDCGDFDPELFV